MHLPNRARTDAWPGPVPRFQARRFVQRMQGKSQAALVETYGGHFVVKWQQNRQHRRILVNEAVCSELLQRVGVASPGWAWIGVDRQFLARNPQTRIDWRGGSIAIEPGWHFGTPASANSHSREAYDSPPSSFLGQVSNPWDFLKIFVFDIWVDNRDRRQAIFFRLPRHGLEAQMIDNGHTLGFDGTEWNFSSAPVRRPYPGLQNLYSCAQCHADGGQPRSWCDPWPEGLSSCDRAKGQFELVVARIQEVSRDDLDRILELIPPEWIGEDRLLLCRHFDRLIGRGARLRDSVSQALAYLRQENTTTT